MPGCSEALMSQTASQQELNIESIFLYYRYPLLILSALLSFQASTISPALYVCDLRTVQSGLYPHQDDSSTVLDV